MRELSDHSVETGVDIGKGNEDPSKSIIPPDDWRRAGGVRRTAERSVRIHAKSNVRIGGVTRCKAIGSYSIQDTRAWRRPVNLAGIKKAASSNLGGKRSVLADVAE